MAFGPISAFWSTGLAQVKALLAALPSISSTLKELLPLFSVNGVKNEDSLEQQRASSLRLIRTQRGKARRLWFGRAR